MQCNESLPSVYNFARRAVVGMRWIVLFFFAACLAAVGMAQYTKPEIDVRQRTTPFQFPPPRTALLTMAARAGLASAGR